MLNAPKLELKGPKKCHTFPKVSRRAHSEYVRVEIFRTDQSEKIRVLYVAMAEEEKNKFRVTKRFPAHLVLPHMGSDTVQGNCEKLKIVELS